MPYIHLVEGAVGSGKSTFASRLSEEYRAPRLILDDWMASLYNPDRPSTGNIEWYLERKGRCIEKMWKISGELIDSGTDAILELGLIQYSERQKFYERVESAGYNLKIYVLNASRETRRERVQNRNKQKPSTYSMEVPDHIFELASSMWEPIDESECCGFEVEFICTDS
ncbi:ATP-binding protein [Porticoccaceae bacterium]|nr:ATP-binding protein [Porticoccaceae bacterium]